MKHDFGATTAVIRRRADVVIDVGIMWPGVLATVHPGVELRAGGLVVVNWFARSLVPWSAVDSVVVDDRLALVLRDGRRVNVAAGVRLSEVDVERSSRGDSSSPLNRGGPSRFDTRPGGVPSISVGSRAATARRSGRCAHDYVPTCGT
ncbi:hypothetical protein ABTZ99_22900 [Actinosynnema sp. NPDC002837]